MLKDLWLIVNGIFCFLLVSYLTPIFLSFTASLISIERGKSFKT